MQRGKMKDKTLFRFWWELNQLVEFCDQPGGFCIMSGGIAAERMTTFGSVWYLCNASNKNK